MNDKIDIILIIFTITLLILLTFLEVFSVDNVLLIGIILSIFFLFYKFFVQMKTSGFIDFLFKALFAIFISLLFIIGMYFLCLAILSGGIGLASMYFIVAPLFLLGSFYSFKLVKKLSDE